MKNLRRYYGGLLVMALIAAATAAYAGIKIEVNGRNIHTDPEPLMRSGRVFVPLRTISDHFRSNLKWEPSTKTVTMDTRRDKTLKLQIGVPEAQMGNRKVHLDAAPFVYEGSTMIPLRLVAEAFRADVNWNNATQTVTIQKERRADGGDGEPRRQRREQGY